MRRVLCAALLLLGLALCLYPTVSDHINRAHSSGAIQSLQQQIQQQDPMVLQQYYHQALAYNEALPGSAGIAYEEVLAFADGIMGYLEIPAIDVRLPIYHGTGEIALSRGVGHLPQSPLPIGGAGWHSVLTGHTGLPSAQLLTNLHQLTVGDVFYVHILGQALTYRVERMDVVLPQDTSLLAAQPGEDLCTLITCTPYGINSHRLLVRGKRQEGDSHV